MKFFQRWLFAVKINSWPKMLIPFFWGQSLGVFISHDFFLPPFLIGFSFTFFLTIFIVLLNDFWDQKVDGIKRSLYPNSGSPKTIPDGILPAIQLLLVGMLAGVLAILLSFFAEFFLQRVSFGLMGIICVFIFLLYSAPPIRLNYLGGGEFLEMFGVGFILPICNLYLQAGKINISNLYFLFLSSLSFAVPSAIASGLSDEVSDHKGGKQTFVTKWGNELSKNLILGFSFVGFCFILLTPISHKEIFTWIEVVFLVVFNLILLQNLYVLKKKAVTEAFLDIQHFKSKLHLLIWGNFLILSIMFLGKGWVQF